MRKFLFFLFFPFFVYGQNTIGLPDVINYSKQSYKGGLQNWDFKQNKNGIIYVANNEGLLSFNGTYWSLYSLPNKTIVRSVEIGLDNKIYVGGQDELGYFFPDLNGRLQYHSLTRFITDKDNSFGDVWDIILYDKDVFFRTPSKIFKFTNETVTTFNATGEWSYLGKSHGILIANDLKSGLLSYSNNIWKPLTSINELPLDAPVTSILPLQNDSSLVTTLKTGLYILSKNSITKYKVANSTLFENDRIYAACMISDDRIALATNNSGIYIIDKKGNIIQSFSKTEGLQNNNILSIFLDKQSNLWLGLDNGIDFIAYNSAIKQITPNFQDGSGYTVLLHDNRLYMGTSNGLFSVALQQTNDLSFSKGNFVPVENSKGQTWTLAEINNQLLLGSHEGAFVVRNNSLQALTNKTGYWNFTPLTSVFPTPAFVGGNYKGLSFFNSLKEQFAPSEEISGFEESSRFISIDRYENIWVSHPYHGVYKITTAVDGSHKFKLYTNKNGLPSTLNNHIYKIKNDVVVATEKGVYSYNQQKDLFEVSLFYHNIFGDQSLRYLKEDNAGNIWFIHNKIMGVADFSEKEPTIIYLPELTDKMLSGFEYIYPVNQNNIFLGGEKGFFHINYEKYKKVLPELSVQISTVKIINKKDSVLFGGYYVNGDHSQGSENKISINHRWKTIRIEFSSALFGYQPNLEYSYKLEGFENNWSEWNKRTEKEYTNLSAGNYTFLVKVRNNLGNESQAATYTFTILPPWYQTTGANIIYLLIFLSFAYLLYKWQKKKFLSQQAKYEEEQKRLLYIHELERGKSESEIVSLRNNNLESEITFKNSELASSAMHLVKKGELLSKIKGELTQIMKGIESTQTTSELKKMIKSLNEDDNIDQEWENFSKHFDKVHSDFLIVLKQNHPTITPNELKLCAYLRMNLSTKEIAQLLNISVRGVEISRYRLRKRLGISSETNLFDYLIKFQTKSK
jgi:ligand-binding sensor domain-containing protein/DNA-binding CsgD family transcriptional regulator